LVESDDELDLDMNTLPQASAEKAEQKSDGALREAPEDDDKKLRFRTNYEGFNIYGWTLCLLVTRKGDKGKAKTVASEPKRQVLMEEWISTQAQGDLDEE
jgi:hypothetical protein